MTRPPAGCWGTVPDNLCWSISGIVSKAHLFYRCIRVVGSSGGRSSLAIKAPGDYNAQPPPQRLQVGPGGNAEARGGF